MVAPVYLKINAMANAQLICLTSWKINLKADFNQ